LVLRVTTFCMWATTSTLTQHWPRSTSGDKGGSVCCDVLRRHTVLGEAHG
jgi:hypothetical protein